MKNSALRKGAWDGEEDLLLRSCIEKFGEGTWYLVPQRAGLSRCPKSCSFRWLNYLNPNIQRGGFKEDEIDLIFKLQKLLGNRWSLIAGRLPGRTANDIKNLWYSHLSKRPDTKHPKKLRCKLEKFEVMKPQPRAFHQTESLGEGVSENQLPNQQMEGQERGRQHDFTVPNEVQTWKSRSQCSTMKG